MKVQPSFIAQALVLAASMLMVGVAASPSPGPTASAAPVNAQVMARAKTWLLAMQSGTIDRTQLTPKMNSLFTDAGVKQLADEAGPFGAPTVFTQRSIVHQAPNTAYVYNVMFANGTKALMIFALDDATSKVSGLRLTPSP